MKLSANTIRSIKHAVLAFLAVLIPQVIAISGPVTTKVILGLVASAAVVVYRQVDPNAPVTFTKVAYTVNTMSNTTNLGGDTSSPSPGDSASTS